MATNTKKKYYAVLVGQEPGIYETWSGPGSASEQVSGYPGAKYKGFPTRREAQDWMDAVGIVGTTTHIKEKKGTNEEKGTGTNVLTKPSGIKLRHAPAEAAIKDGKIVIYTDGGCLNNPGPGGYGVVLISGTKRKELSAGFTLTTNNRMELLACIEGLKALKKPSDVVLFSDSQYVVNGITKGWAKRWRSKKWMRTPIDPAVNPDLWAQLLELTEKHNVEFRWVKGHAGNPGNERCDELANEASADTATQKPDSEFEKSRRKQKTLF